MSKKNQVKRISDGNIEARLNDDGRTITVYDVNATDAFGEFEEVLTVTNMPHLASKCFRRPNYRAGANAHSSMVKLYEALMDRPEMQDYL